MTEKNERIAIRSAIYRADNPEKVKASVAKYKAANPEKVKASVAKYKAANPEKVKARKAKYYASNDDYFIINRISLKYKVPAPELKNLIPQDLIDVKILQLTLHRLIKEKGSNNVPARIE